MNPEELYDEISQRMCKSKKEVALGKMMSSPGIQYKGKIFAFFFKEEMTFKLGKDFDILGQGVKEIRHLSPFKTKPPLKAWFIVGLEESYLWDQLADLAYDQIIKEIK